MPEEIFAIIIVFILFVLAPTAIFKGIKGLRETQNSEGSRSSSDNAMRRSELEAMIEDAVLEATAPLAARIDDLEHEVLMGEGRITPDVLAEALEEPEDPDDFEAEDRPRQRA